MLGARSVLTWKRARTYCLALGFIYVFAWLHALADAQPPLNRAGEPLGGDYIAFYAAGRLVLTGQAAAMYDHATVLQVQDAALGGRVPGFYDAFRNPPFFALPFVPLAWLDLLPSAAIYTLLSAGALSLAVYLLLDEVPALRPRWRGLAAIVFAFPPVFFGLIDGENATWSLLLYVLLYRTLRREQDARAGLWAGLGLFKPQLFFLFPLLFLVTRRWRALAACCGTLVVLAGLSLALVGVDGVQGWGRILLEMESGNASRNAWRMHSFKSFFDQLLPTAPAASGILYAACGMLCTAGAWRVWRTRQLDALTWSLTCLVAVLVDPHLVDYDLSVLVAAGILCAQHEVRTRWVIAILYPVLTLRAAVPVGDSALQLSVPLLVLTAWIVWSRCRLDYHERSANTARQHHYSVLQPR